MSEAESEINVSLKMQIIEETFWEVLIFPV